MTTMRSMLTAKKSQDAEVHIMVVGAGAPITGRVTSIGAHIVEVTPEPIDLGLFSTGRRYLDPSPFHIAIDRIVWIRNAVDPQREERDQS